MIALNEIKKHIHTVTSEQIGRCHKVLASTGNFYLVESEADSRVEYKVAWTKQHGFTCQCKAGQVGFVHCRNGYCKHVLWSVACEAELQAAMKELEAASVASQPAPSVPSIEQSVPAWMLTRPVASHMRYAPCEK
jgi:hypothetical protein